MTLFVFGNFLFNGLVVLAVSSSSSSYSFSSSSFSSSYFLSLLHHKQHTKIGVAIAQRHRRTKKISRIITMSNIRLSFWPSSKDRNHSLSSSKSPPSNSKGMSVMYSVIRLSDSTLWLTVPFDNIIPDLVEKSSRSIRWSSSLRPTLLHCNLPGISILKSTSGPCSHLID